MIGIVPDFKSVHKILNNWIATISTFTYILFHNGYMVIQMQLFIYIYLYGFYV